MRVTVPHTSLFFPPFPSITRCRHLLNCFHAVSNLLSPADSD